MAEEPKKEPEHPDNQDSKPVDWEKRYKDEQPALTKAQQELKTSQAKVAEYEEGFQAIQPYVDWDGVQGKTKSPADGEVGEDAPVYSKQFDAKLKAQDAKFNRGMMTMQFRSKYPEMMPYEDVVAAFMPKVSPTVTDPWKRVEKAVEFAKNLLEEERKKGVTEAEKAKEELKKKEAEADGLEPKGKAPEEPSKKPQTPQEYVDELRAAQDKTANF